MFDFNRSRKSIRKQKTRFKLKNLVLPSLPPKIPAFFQKTSHDIRSLPKIAERYPKTSEDLRGVLKMFEGQERGWKEIGKFTHFFDSRSKIAEDHPMSSSD